MGLEKSIIAIACSWWHVLVAIILFIPGIVFVIKVLCGDGGLTASTKSRPIKINKRTHYSYGVSEMRGRRSYMEDRHVAVDALNGDVRASFYAVFDGHGGDGASEFCVQRMPYYVSVQTAKIKDPKQALVEAFMRTDAEYVALATRMNRDDGTTAVGLLVYGDSLYVANAGDSRAVLVQKDGAVVPLSVDHKPNRADERKRILDLGGSVLFWGVWRVEGVLAVSRAIGDRILKTFVTARPEVQEWTRTNQDVFVVIASDGVWDVLSNEEAAGIAVRADDAQLASKMVMEEAYNRGSADNICVMIVDLRQQN